MIQTLANRVKENNMFKLILKSNNDNMNPTKGYAHNERSSQHTSVRTLALEDITKETTILNKQERYTVTASDIDTKESSMLNRELGVHRINK